MAPTPRAAAPLGSMVLLVAVFYFVLDCVDGAPCDSEFSAAELLPRQDQAGSMPLVGVAVPCGIGFTMTFFVGSLEFEAAEYRECACGFVLGSCNQQNPSTIASAFRRQSSPPFLKPAHLSCALSSIQVLQGGRIETN
jgi:hypothetical protein